MKNEEKAKVLSSDTKDYVIEGKPVVSNRIRLNVLGEIYSISTTKEQVEEYKKHVGKDGTAVFSFSSPKEKLKMSIDSFEPN